MYAPYLDSKKKAEIISTMVNNGRTRKEISHLTGISLAGVSYYLRKMGKSRPRRRNAAVCPVCLKAPLDRPSDTVCRGSDCLGVMVAAMRCRMDQEAAEHKVLLDLYNIDVPIDTFVICTKDGVDRLFLTDGDHLLYHAYRYRKSRGLPASRPPTPMWVDPVQLRAYKERKKEAEYARRNRFSEYPQPREFKSARGRE